jgi:RNA polymerase sigma-70 factor, ECF subfamily
MESEIQNDERIAGKVQAGDVEAFGLLIERYEPKLLRYGRKFLYDREDVKDLVQDVFIKAYVNIHSFDASKRFSPWIYRIAHNSFINAAKARQRGDVNFFDPDVILPHLVSPDTAEEHASRVESRRAIEQSLDKLDAKYREPVVLYYFEEMDYKEIAEILEMPVSTVGVRLQRAKEMLKKVMKERRLFSLTYKNSPSPGKALKKSI